MDWVKNRMERIKSTAKGLKDSVVCFFHETCALAKSIFGKKSDYDVEYKDLTPIDDVSGCEEHIKALEWAISNTKIKNIALAGPYGSGKSSLIETFLRRNPLLKEKSIKISLATFSGEKTSDSKIDLKELEEGILKQLFYKIKQSRIPQSRYRKLHRVEYWPIFIKTITFSTIALILLFIFWPNKFDAGFDLILDAGCKLYSYIIPHNEGSISSEATAATISKYTLDTISLSVFLVFSLLLLAGLSRILQLFSVRLSIKEIKLPANTTINHNTPEPDSIFDKNMDEIVYFFEATDYRLVIIEDLDRFKNPKIFIQLRELNTLLNNCDTIKEPVIFLYAINDDLFKDAERTKFFDFIIPVIPVINSTNSSETLLEMLNPKAGDGINHGITRGYILDVSPFISDMRILQNIYNEFLLYKATLKTGQGLTLNDEQMMSLIVLKNLYPHDFANLQAERGVVKQAFNDKTSFIATKQKEIRQQVTIKTKTLENIAIDALNSALELKCAMLGALTNWKGVANRLRMSNTHDYNADKILSDTFDMSVLLKSASWSVYYSNTSISTDISKICTPYVERYEYLQFSSDEHKKQLKSEIEVLEANSRAISSLTLRDLIDKYGADEVFSSEDVKNHSLLVFLLRKGYINEEYAGYINFFKPKSITTEDRNFILSVKNQEPLPFTYSLSKIPETLELLQLHEFSEKAILNFDLLKYMLLETHYNAELEVYFQQLADETTTSWNFINDFIDQDKTQKYFVKRIASAWSGLWDAVYQNNALTYDRKIKYIEWLLCYTDLDTLKSQNQNGLISKFFEENDDILQKLPDSLANRLTEIIPALRITFCKIKIDGASAKILDFVFENGYYVLNTDMIHSIVQFKKPSLIERLNTQNYTVITELGFDALTNKIHDNWETYIDQIILSEKNTQESVDSVCMLFDRSIADQARCSRIAEHLEFAVDDITQVCADSLTTEAESVKHIWDQLLSLGEVTVSWNNVYAYWRYFSISPALLKYIEINSYNLSISDCSCLDDNFKQELILSDLGLAPFIEILPCIRQDEFNIALAEIEVNKLRAMIQQQSFDFTTADYRELSAYAPELCSEFILLNQEAYAAKMDNIELTKSVFEKLILSDQLNSNLKQKVVNQNGETLMTVAAADYLSHQNITISPALFSVIWNIIEANKRKDFLFKHLSLLDANDFEHYFSELGAPYDRLKRTACRHDEFIPDTVQNKELVKRLQELQFLTSFQYEDQIQYSSERITKTLPVIRCRVKATQ